MTERRKVQLYNNIAVFPKKVYSANEIQNLTIQNGSRLVFTLHVFSKDPGATVQMKVKTSFSEHMPFCDVLTLTGVEGGYAKKILTDFHGFIDIDLIITGGNVELIAGMSVFDNAVSTRIENAHLDVNLTQDDEITVYQGTDPWIVKDDDLTQDDEVTVYQGTDPWIVQQDKLDETTDSVTAFQDSPWNVVIDNIDLDIRNLNHVADGGGNYDSTRIGNGEYEVEVTEKFKMQILDVLDGGGVDGVIALTTTPKLVFVGASAKADREYLMLEGGTSGIQFGFSNTTQSFTLAKKEKIFVPFGANTEVWAKMAAGAGTIKVGEVG